MTLDPQHGVAGPDGVRPMLVPTGDISTLVELGMRLQREASQHNIHNVFDDGGYKELLLLTLFNLRKLQRVGDDAIDEQGRTYEIKTVARVSARGARKPRLQVTTEHTMTLDNIHRYRNVHLWIVAVFDQAQPEEIYEVSPAALEAEYFSKWETELRQQEVLRVHGGARVHLNNRKIPLRFIAERGTRVWPEGQVDLPDRVEDGLQGARVLGGD